MSEPATSPEVAKAETGSPSAFEREKWLFDKTVRQEELRLKEKELELRAFDASRSRWSNPLMIAIAAAAAAAIGNSVVSHLSSRDQIELEQRKATDDLRLQLTKSEADRILEVVKVGEPDKAAANLGVLLDTFLITDPTTRKNVAHYLDTRQQGQGLSLPASQPAAPAPLIQFEPPPPPIGSPPFRLALDDVRGAHSHPGKLVFQVAGNVGGVKYPDFLLANVEAMKDDIADSFDKPDFLYVLGNITYYSANKGNYYGQFFAPFATYPLPILAIPGNHDGERDGPDGRSLAGYYDVFCSPKPSVPPEAGDTGRQTVNEPNSYWTLRTPQATIIGLYTNVPAGGNIDADQRRWLAQEMTDAPRDRALIIALHHSPFSFDDSHSGSSRMWDEIRTAINASRRLPNLVLSATPNNYQRLTVPIAGHQIPFLVLGNGGYWNLFHQSVKPGAADDQNGVRLEALDDINHGFVTLEIDGASLKGRYRSSTPPPRNDATAVADDFMFSATAISLSEGQSVPFSLNSATRPDIERGGGQAQVSP